MSQFIATFPDGYKYFVCIVEYKDDTVIVETRDRKQAEVKFEDLILT